METKLLFESRGQGQVFRFWDELNETEKAALLSEAEEIDLDELDVLVKEHVLGGDSTEGSDFEGLAPAPYTTIPEDPNTDAEWIKAKETGEAALRAGKVAAFTVAGGQGTRLGYDGPKGTFPVTPIKGKSLFQVFAEKIQAARVAYGCELPWFIMTSHINHEATESFFVENGYFGLDPKSVRFFKQGRMPAVDFEGKIILESKSQIAMSPDGHGGSLRALDRSGALSYMNEKGIEVISYFQVDNPLVQPIDPYFIGFHLLAGSEMSSKMLPKAYEKEKLGHFCIQDGKTVVVEYSDIPEELVYLRDEDGQLTYRAGSIAIHAIATTFAAKLTAKGSELALPFHRADKKIPYASEDGSTAKPESANGVKFEMFVFDALPFAENPLILETTRLGDFSPVKNAEGVDSPESCKKDQQTLFANWLKAAGVEVPDDYSGRIEVSPLYAASEADFVAAWNAKPLEIDFSKDLYLE